MKWISVKNKRPSVGQEVLATDGISAKEATYKGSIRAWDQEGVDKDDYPEFIHQFESCSCCYDVCKPVTHWMRIEDYPKDDEEGSSKACSDCLKEFYLETLGTVKHTIHADIKCAKKHKDDDETT